MHGCLRIYLCTTCMLMLGVGGGQDRDQIPWDWRYRLQWAAMWVLRLEPMSSGRTASPLDCWAISPALTVCPKEQHIFFLQCSVPLWCFVCMMLGIKEHARFLLLSSHPIPSYTQKTCFEVWYGQYDEIRAERMWELTCLPCEILQLNEQLNLGGKKKITVAWETDGGGWELRNGRVRTWLTAWQEPSHPSLGSLLAHSGNSHALVGRETYYNTNWLLLFLYIWVFCRDLGDLGPEGNEGMKKDTQNCGHMGCVYSDKMPPTTSRTQSLNVFITYSTRWVGGWVGGGEGGD